MKRAIRTHRRLTLAGCAIACCTFAGQYATAQQMPDAGTLLREQPKPPAPPAAPAKIAPPAAAEKPAEVAGPRVLVKGFRIKGALLVSEAELQVLLRDAIGKELSLGQLQALTQRLTAYYSQRGYLARVVLPPQEIKDGVVEIRIVEGKRGGLTIDNRGERIDSARVLGFIDRRLPPGAAMNLTALGEAVAIINEQPGIEAKATLAPGKGEAATDLVVTAAEKPILSGNLTVNNHGSDAAGDAQVQGSIALNNPSGRFDAASLLLNAAAGTTYARLDYSTAVGDAGLRLGINASNLNYEAKSANLAALAPSGTATTYGLVAGYPLTRRADLGLSLSGSYDSKELVDRTRAGETGNRRVSVVGVGFSGTMQSRPDSLLGGGSSSFGLGLSFGDSRQQNATARAADRTTRRIEGAYSKLSYNLGHVRPITQDLSLNAALRGQFASKNLESTERFSLGGPGGVRGYPAGEAGGDEGWQASLSLRRTFGDNLAASVFFDAGGITINHDTWANWNAGNPRLPNSYEIYGIGGGIDWRFASKAMLSASIAVPLTDNPGRDRNNHNADGQGDRTRLWLTLSAQF